MTASRERLLDALTEVLEPNAGELRKPPAAVARLVLVFCAADAFGPFGDSGNVDGGEMASLLLDGLLIIPAGDKLVPTNDKPLVVPIFGKTDKC
jgi:hypothetical protein